MQTIHPYKHRIALRHSLFHIIFHFFVTIDMSHSKAEKRSEARSGNLASLLHAKRAIHETCGPMDDTMLTLPTNPKCSRIGVPIACDRCQKKRRGCRDDRGVSVL